MARACKQRSNLAAFAEPAGIHHRHPVTGFRDHPEVVRDQHQRHAKFIDQTAQQAQDLVLNGHIERRGWLIGQQQSRIGGERDSDHGALAHSAGKFVRELAEPCRAGGDPDEVQQVQRAGAAGAGIEIGMGDEGFGDLQPDRQHRVQRRHGFLKDHADLPAAQPAQAFGRHREHIVSLPGHLAGYAGEIG